jgi:hypothetical protein
MENKGLLFIPDISGFSRFVSETEIGHSRLIIQELLEILINTNHIGLQISEIEGDAILFYKFGTPPPLEEIYKQVEEMFCAFHRSLVAYEQRRYCQCAACISAVKLSLKVVTHYGEFTGYTIKDFNKLIGKDVIVAHQLLKNDIEPHEYWLVTQSLLPNGQPADFAAWMRWNRSAKQTESGEVSFQYTQLSQLRKELPLEPPSQLELAEKVNVMSVSHEYETDIITLFHASGDFNYRSRWRQGVHKMEGVDHYLPRVGMRCRCVTDSGETIIYASSYYYSPDRIEFSETEEGTKNTTYYTLQSLGTKRTRLTLDLYVKKNLWQQLLFRLLWKGKVEDAFSRSLQNLVPLVKEIRVPSAVS